MYEDDEDPLIYEGENFSDFERSPNAVVLDIETTGIDAKDHRVVSLAMVKMDFAAINTKGETALSLENFHKPFINPQIPIPKDASRVHGITDGDVSDALVFDDIVQDARDFIGNLPVIAHNASFEQRFLYFELDRVGVDNITENKFHCTMRRISDWREEFFIDEKWPTLDEAVELFNPTIAPRSQKKHDAMEDAKIVFQLAFQLYLCDTKKIPYQTCEQIFAPDEFDDDF